MSETAPAPAIDALLEVVRRLRDPEDGCPWDRAQSLASLAPYTLEEAYEVVDAIDRQAWSELRDELGDLLFQVVLQSQLAGEAGHFDFDEVCAAIKDKMVRRHPHVFAVDQHPELAGGLPDWEALKAQEPGRADHDDSALAGVTQGMPGWMRAQKLQKKAARAGFDWSSPLQALAKLEEEVAEVRVELETGGGAARLEDELGDVLFAVISLARHGGVDLSRAMRGANRKFEARFRQMEAIADTGSGLSGLPLPALEALWREAKRLTAAQSPEGAEPVQPDGGVLKPPG
ncbi:nucleoside triphosphate pyrophosphohydrolase [Frateuria aurantia]